MVVVKILVNSELTEEEFGIQAYENNFDGECKVQNDFHCIAEVDGRDTIFGTNDENITVCLPLVDLLANEVVSSLRDRGVGNTYDDELPDEYTNDLLAPFAKAIADKAHEIMKQKYTTQGGDIIIDEELKDCPHKCGDCIGTDEYGMGCMHGCHDCGHNDGSTCLNGESGYYGRDMCQCAHDCIDWDGGE